MSNRYVALLRGINVGGKNIIPMAGLKSCFESGGFVDVATYIASGNVLFSCSEAANAALIARIEAMLEKSFNYKARVVLRSAKQLREIVARVPKGFGKEPEKYRYDVIFLKEPLTATAALKELPVKPGVDAAHAGPGALYFSRLISKVTQSRISKVVAMPMYQSMTIRNWNTTTALLRLMQSNLLERT